jgi:hypothetical protein
VYYDSTGAIVHIHKVVSIRGEEVAQARVAEELEIFERSLRQREKRRLRFLVVAEDDLRAPVDPGVSLRVDVRSRRLLRESADN